MTTIRAYTTIEQSRKLAEILPLESADMYYEWPNKKVHFKDDKYSGMGLSCWSLASLLGVLPKICYFVKDHPTYLILGKPKDKWCALYWDATGMQDGEQTLADNPIDACVEMIIHLHELNLL